MRLWAMRTVPLSVQETEQLLSGLPLSLREKLCTASDIRWQQSLWAYGLLRFAIRATCGIDLPEIAWSVGGKPYFPGQKDLFFNISHTEGAVMVGLSHREIGVDLEKDRAAPVRLWKFFETDRPFFETWVQWEACAKCLGQSVLTLLRKGTLPEDVTYYPIEIFPGYWSGAAVMGEGETVEVRIIELEQVLALCRGQAKD